VLSIMHMFELRVTFLGKHWAVPLANGIYRIGRSVSCDVVAADPRIASEHAALEVSGESLVLRVLEGRRPIMMDGMPVNTTELSSGSSFSIGSTAFMLVTVRGEMDLIDSRAVLSRSVVDANGSGALLPTCAGDEKGNVPSTATFVPNQPTSVRLLKQISSLLSKAGDQQSLANEVLNLVCHRLMATRALLATVQDPENIQIIAVKGLPTDANIKTLISTSVLKQIIDGRQAVLIGDTANYNDGRHDSVLRNNIRAVACTPIFNNSNPEKLTAILYVDNQVRPTEFSAQDAEVLIWMGQVYALLVENLEMRRRLEAEVTVLKKTAAQSVQMLAESPTMVNVLYRAKKAADSEAAMLILGESGVGKECVATFIHQQSPRAGKPFVARNCAAIPENLFESEMFGHKKGAFTGADKDRLGAFLEADGGTLFLDEIGDLAYPLQTKLLRALQERVVRPVGSDREYPVDIRIVCATNKDLRECCTRREFREDLFYRLATVSLSVPPLRERREDIVSLARHFVRALSDGLRTLTPAAEERLQSYAWPGNVRELRSVLEEAVIFSARNHIDVDDINFPSSGTVNINLSGGSLAEAEKRHILQVLESVGGNKSEAAKILMMARSTLLIKLNSYKQIG
jgi:transcriptional regulator with GAF, ATPase, and Fis domain